MSCLLLPSMALSRNRPEDFWKEHGNDRLEEAAAELRAGRPILLFDDPGREGETDIVMLAEKVRSEDVREMRAIAGGLLCVTTPYEIALQLGLGYQHDLLKELSPSHAILGDLLPKSLPYDRRSSFGLWVNARGTFTGVTDADRALTISSIGRFVREAPGTSPAILRKRFCEGFHVPGHVPLLHAATGLLSERKGHTELSTAIAQMGNLTPSLALMEMLGDDGRALPREGAQREARDRGWAFVEGRQVLQTWSRWSV